MIGYFKSEMNDMKKQTKVTQMEKLLNPNYTFTGNPDAILKDYPVRSKNLEKYCMDAKELNPKFVKDGYIYLLRGAKNGQETGFYSREYAKKNTIESLRLDPNKVAYAQRLNGNTPFISATTDIYIAASFANYERIYVLKIPVSDVYKFESDAVGGFIDLPEEEYLIPDYISKEEIIRSFRYDKFRQIYNFLTKEIGLMITPEDLGEMGDIDHPDMDRIEIGASFNNSASYLDPILSALQGNVNDMKLPEEVASVKVEGEQPKRQIAIFADAHALLEPTEAILKDIKARGITEIYSLGDNIGLGPNPSEVVDLLEESGVVTLQGNYESIIDFGVEPFLCYMTGEKIKQMEWTESKLRKDQREKLIASPHFLHLQMANKKIALCHFANDVRCDFWEHNSLLYKQLLDSGIPAYSQFSYTNSKAQLLEIANHLGMHPTVSELSDKDEMLKKLREHVALYKDIFNVSKKGYMSYCEDPLFYQDGHLLTIEDYDIVVQGHVHFNLKETDGKPSIYTIRAAGMGYSTADEKNQASYMILKETSKGVETEIVTVPFDREKMEHSINHSEFVSSDIKGYTLTK